MRAYLVLTGMLFAVLTLLHIWRIVVEWSGFDGNFWSLGGVTILTALLAYWAWRLFADLARQG